MTAWCPGPAIPGALRRAGASVAALLLLMAAAANAAAAAPPTSAEWTVTAPGVPPAADAAAIPTVAAPVTPAPTRTTGAMNRFTVMLAAKHRKPPA